MLLGIIYTEQEGSDGKKQFDGGDCVEMTTLSSRPNGSCSLSADFDPRQPLPVIVTSVFTDSTR
jgi:hypothetical protein